MNGSWHILCLTIWSMIYTDYSTCALDISPVPATGAEGGTIVLTCITSAVCNSQIFQWDMDDANQLIVLYRNSNCLALSNVPDSYSYTCGPQRNSCVYTLSLINVHINQNGDKWKCIMSGEESPETEVVVTGAFTQILQISPNPATVVQNRTLQLICSVSFEESCPVLQWFKNGRPFTFVLFSSGQCKPLSNIPSGYSYTCGPQGNSCIYTFSWSNVKLDQNGDKWKCIVPDAISSETEVIVTVPITGVTMTDPISSQVNVSEHVGTSFVCVTSPGKPAATIRWYKRAGTTPPDEILDNVDTNQNNSGLLSITRSTLTFVPSRSDHNYQIYCTAYNGDEQTLITSLNKPSLYVSYPCEAPLIQITANDSEYRIIDGILQTLRCTAEGGRPLASLTWNCFNVNEQVSTTGATVISSVTWTAERSQDGQRCTCQPSYSIAEWNRQAYVQIKVLYPPSLPVLTVNGRSISGVVSVVENGTVYINCSSDSLPAATYSWSSRITSTTNRVLTLPNVNLSNDGTQYTCTARNKMDSAQGTKEGSNANHILLNVLYSPRNPNLRFGRINGQVTTSHQPFSVVRGDDFSINCEFTSNPVPASYQWTGQTGNNNILTVRGIQTDRSWTCTATNIMTSTGGSSITGVGNVTVKVTVLYGSSISSFTINGRQDFQSIFNHSSTLSLRCHVDSNPGSTISIKRENRELYRVADGTEANLTLTNVTCLDAGIYTCIAFNEYNVEYRPSTRRDVIIRSSPIVVDAENNKVFYAAINGNITITMIVCAYPIPNLVRWYKYINNIGFTNFSSSTTSNHPQYSLTFNAITQNDFGVYQIVLDNGVGIKLTHEFVISEMEKQSITVSNDKKVTEAVVGVVTSLILIAIVVVFIIVRRRYSILCECRKRSQGNEQAKQYQNVAYVKDQTEDKSDYALKESSRYESLDQRDTGVIGAYDALHSQTDLSSSTANERSQYESLGDFSDNNRSIDKFQANSSCSAEAISSPKVYGNLQI